MANAAAQNIIPIYRFISETDANLAISLPNDINFSDGFRVRYSHAIYHLRCDPDKDNDVHTYLAANPYGGTTNIIGFLKFMDEPISPSTRQYIPDPQDYIAWARKFRLRAAYEVRNRVVFITTHQTEPDNVIRIANNVTFQHINCPLSGMGRDEVIVTDRYGDDVIPGQEAICDHPDYPLRGCPPNSVAANLGDLMPNPNRKELNLIGDESLKGIVVFAVAPPGKDYMHLNSTSEAREIDLYASKFINHLAQHPVDFQQLVSTDVSCY